MFASCCLNSSCVFALVANWSGFEYVDSEPDYDFFFVPSGGRRRDNPSTLLLPPVITMPPGFLTHHNVKLLDRKAPLGIAFQFVARTCAAFPAHDQSQPVGQQQKGSVLSCQLSVEAPTLDIAGNLCRSPLHSSAPSKLALTSHFATVRGQDKLVTTLGESETPSPGLTGTHFQLATGKGKSPRNAGGQAKVLPSKPKTRSLAAAQDSFQRWAWSLSTPAHVNKCGKLRRTV